MEPSVHEITQEVGFVKSIRDFLVYFDGLPTIKVNELVKNDEGIRGWVSALLPDKVEVLLLDEGRVYPGQIFRRSGEKLTIPVGQFLLGRAINPLGVPIDGKGPLAKTKTDMVFELDRPAPGIPAREFINEQFDTGITMADTLVPIGKGQRELIIGDARSGKTDFLVNIIVNQKRNNQPGKKRVICIYALIGKPVAEVRGLIDTLRQNEALDHTIVVAASSTDLAPLIFLTPQTAFSMAEYFQTQGQDVLLILDDMGNHAKIYREISLLSNKAPGRESYPGDIFYQHSHLLERGGKFNAKAGGGSITALPVIELNLNDFTTFIPTNLMAMTDGHLMFKSSLYNQGQRPSIDISLSVSRVGQQTQNRVQNSLATRVKQVLAQAARLETVSRFSFELPIETRMILKQREIIEELLKQPHLSYIPKEVQTILLALPFASFMQDKDRAFIQTHQQLLAQLFLEDPQLSEITKTSATMPNDQALIEALEKATLRLSEVIKQSRPTTSKEAK